MYSSRDIKRNKAIVKSIVEPIITARRDRTIARIYERCRPDAEGKLHTVLSVDTASMRLSSKETILFPNSTNLQNMPNKTAKLDSLYEVRDIFVPLPGYMIVSVDYSGAESVCVGAYSKDWAYVEALLSGVDTHTEHAKLFFGEKVWNEASPEERKLMRFVAKQITYASYYSATVPTITRTINKDSDITGVSVTEAEVRAHRSKLLQAHPLEQWWNSVAEELRKNQGALRNCFGFRRVFHDPRESERLKQALSFLPQSTVAWLMNENVVKLSSLKGQAFLDLQVHDELRFQCKPSYVPTLMEELTPFLQREFSVHGRKLYIPVEWKVGLSWGKMHKINSSNVRDVVNALEVVDSGRAE